MNTTVVEPRHRTFEAIRLHPDNFKEAAWWCGGRSDSRKFHSPDGANVKVLVPNVIGSKAAHLQYRYKLDHASGQETLEISNADWIVLDERNRFVVYTDSEFQREFQEAVAI